MADSRITKLATQFEPIVLFIGEMSPEVQARQWLQRVEDAGLVVTDPTAAPYSLVTHEYPPTLELAKAQINYLANTNHALHMHLRAAWNEGHEAGVGDGQRLADLDPDPYTPNPYRPEKLAEYRSVKDADLGGDDEDLMHRD